MLQLTHLAGFAGGGTVALSSLTQVGSGTSTVNTGALTSSVTIQAGDLLVVYGRSNQIASGAAAFPPGFSAAVTILNTTANKMGIYYKIADGTEGTSVTGFSGNNTAFNMLYVFRGNVAIKTVTVGEPESQQTSGNPSAQVCSASGGIPPLVVLGSYQSNPDNTDPRSFTPAKDGEINSSLTAYLAYKIYNTSPADVTIDMNDQGTENTLASCYLACA